MHVTDHHKAEKKNHKALVIIALSSSTKYSIQSQAYFWNSNRACCWRYDACTYFNLYSCASDSCCTSLKRRGDFIEPCATSDFKFPACAKCFLIKRETRIWGRFCHSFITSFGVFTLKEKSKNYIKEGNNFECVLTWSPLSRSSSATHTMAARMPAWCVSAENTVHSISMLTTPALLNLLRYSILSSSLKSQNAPSMRPWPGNDV